MSIGYPRVSTQNQSRPSSSTRRTLLGVPRCLSGRPLASNPVGPSRQLSTADGLAID
jgi:hypothetical protein